MIPVLIPAYQPNEAIIALVEACRKEGLTDFVIVNDGSDAEKNGIFLRLSQMGCQVLSHEKNRGKGAALKTGFAYLSKECPEAEGVVTADADGQHRPEDIARVAKALKAGGAVLGTRDFSEKNVPFRSLFGNRVSTFLFRALTGVHCPDTQTGLRAFSKELLPLLLACEGERFEYEMNVLSELADRKIPLLFEPIETVYIDRNASSHFRPVRDSMLIYRHSLRFVLASLTCFLLDYTLFTLLHWLMGASPWSILLPTVLARCLSGALNFTMNRKWSFSAKGKASRQLTRYTILFFTQMLTSYLLVQLLSFLPLPAPVWKIPVDTCLFVLSFVIQRRWVYRKED